MTDLRASKELSTSAWVVHKTLESLACGFVTEYPKAVVVEFLVKRYLMTKILRIVTTNFTRIIGPVELCGELLPRLTGGWHM